MREIKFRAWDKRDGLHRMIYLNGFIPYGEGWYGGNPDYKFYQLYIGQHGCTSVDAKDIELMQYICLYDKNGKEIYEGDILQWDNNGYPTKNVIQFVANGFWLTSKNGENHLPNVREVIGNIYEHPELLQP